MLRHKCLFWFTYSYIFNNRVIRSNKSFLMYYCWTPLKKMLERGGFIYWINPRPLNWFSLYSKNKWDGVSVPVRAKTKRLQKISPLLVILPWAQE